MHNLIKQELKAHYHFRFNTVKQIVEYCANDKKEFCQVTERDKYSILSKIKEKVPTCSAKQLKEIIMSDFSVDADPFLGYFESLPKWDGKDYIEELCQTIVTDDQEHFSSIFRKFLYSMVKGMIEPEFVNQAALVLIGGQGIGKSTWLCKLVPRDLKHYVHNGPIDPQNKDDVRKLAECMMINLDELDAMGRHNAARLKELITRGEINQRKAYGSDNEIYIRRASFVASLNNYQFLHDQSGNRRFWCFRVLDIDQDVIVDMDKVFTQVYEEVKKGVSTKITIEEASKINHRNVSFLHLSPIEESIMLDFVQATKETGHFFQAKHVAEMIKKNVGVTHVSQGFKTKVGFALSKRFDKSRKGNLSGYYLRQLTSAPVELVNTPMQAA